MRLAARWATGSKVWRRAGDVCDWITIYVMLRSIFFVTRSIAPCRVGWDMPVLVTRIICERNYLRNILFRGKLADRLMKQIRLQHDKFSDRSMNFRIAVKTVRAQSNGCCAAGRGTTMTTTCAAPIATGTRQRIASNIAPEHRFCPR